MHLAGTETPGMFAHDHANAALLNMRRGPEDGGGLATVAGE